MRRPPTGIVIVSALMIVFGLAEVVTAFRHAFFGLTTEANVGSTLSGAAIGLLYVTAGVLAWTLKRQALVAALACLALDVAGRLAMLALGYFPVETPRQLAGMVLGTLIVALFGGYLYYRRDLFV
jgi:hypothetical protein